MHQVTHTSLVASLKDEDGDRKEKNEEKKSSGISIHTIHYTLFNIVNVTSHLRKQEKSTNQDW